jgi:outer membrane biosynthesis protein TonB
LGQFNQKIVRRWRFDRPKADGKPSGITIGVEVKFRLGE